MLKNEIISAIEKYKIIAILRGIPRSELLDTAEALFKGGIRLLEITYSADNKVSDEETAENIRKLAEHFGDRLLIGSGTVLKESQVALTAQSGGKYIISPDTNAKVIRATNEAGMVSIPGALTPTEIVTAHRAGADFVKIFPVTNLGTDYVKALKAPLSHIRLLAVGGIDENNMRDYLRCGICGFGIGSNLADKKRIAEHDWAGLASHAAKFIEGIADV